MQALRIAVALVAVWLLAGCAGAGVALAGDRADGDRDASVPVPGYKALAALGDCRIWAEVGYRVALDRDFGADPETILKTLASQPASRETTWTMRIVRFAHASPELSRAEVRAAVMAQCRRYYGLPEGI